VFWWLLALNCHLQLIEHINISQSAHWACLLGPINGEPGRREGAGPITCFCSFAYFARVDISLSGKYALHALMLVYQENTELPILSACRWVLAGWTPYPVFTTHFFSHLFSKGRYCLANSSCLTHHKKHTLSSFFVISPGFLYILSFPYLPPNFSPSPCQTLPSLSSHKSHPNPSIQDVKKPKPTPALPVIPTDNFRMNTRYGRYGAAYNMVGLLLF
jgi:hypothetical protein